MIFQGTCIILFPGGFFLSFSHTLFHIGFTKSWCIRCIANDALNITDGSLKYILC